MENFPIHCLPLEIFINPSVVENYRCELGKNILNNPVNNKDGKSFCLGCISDLKDADNQQYEYDNQSLYPISFLKHLIDKTETRCLNYLQGCKFISNLELLRHHFEEDCIYKVIKCDNTFCSIKIQRREISEHKEICEYRKSLCEYCKQEFAFKYLEEHKESCEYKLADCYANCGRLVKQIDLESHIKSECDETIYECDFKFHGCDFSAKRPEYIKHILENFARHAVDAKAVLKSKAENCANLVNENERLKKVNLEYENERLMRVNLEYEHERLIKKISDTIKENQLLKKDKKNLEEKIGNISRSLTEKSETKKDLKNNHAKYQKKLQKRDKLFKQYDSKIKNISRKLRNFSAYIPYSLCAISILFVLSSLFIPYINAISKSIILIKLP